jgi:hypothetical protein
LKSRGAAVGGMGLGIGVDLSIAVVSGQ